MNATMQARMNKPATYSQDTATTRNPPEKKFRAGAITATVWSNPTVKDGKASDYKSVSFERSFKDPQGNWKTTHSLRINDLPKAELVLRKAYEYLALSGDSQKEAMMDEEIVY